MTPIEIADALGKAEVYDVADCDHDFGELLLDAAATIRAQAEALKIATEALERIGLTPLSLAECIAESHKALARIKELSS